MEGLTVRLTMIAEVYGLVTAAFESVKSAAAL
jgi:hypothetical protein